MILDMGWQVLAYLTRHGIITLTPLRAAIIAEENADRVLNRGKARLEV